MKHRDHWGHGLGRSLVPGLWALAATVWAGPLTAQPSRAGTNPADTLTIVQSARSALESHPAARAARWSVRGAEAERGEAASAWLPSLSSRFTVSRFEEPMVVAPFHGLDRQNAPAFDRTTLQGGFALGYTLFDGGARPARVAAAERRIDAARAGVAETDMELLDRVVSAYLSALTIQEVLDAQRQRFQALSEERERARRFVDEGASPRIELLRAEAALSEARAEMEATELRRGLALRELARLTGRDEASVEGATLAPPPPATDMAVVEGEAAPPSVRQARSQVAAAREARRVARAAWLPRLDADAGYTQFGAPDEDFTGEWQVAVRVSYPLFTGGARSAASDQAEARHREADQRLELTRLQARSRLDQARTRLLEAEARTESLEAAVRQFEEVERIEALALEAGAGVQTDLLAAQASLLRARAELARSRNDALAARASLARAMGVLTVEWIEGRWGTVESNERQLENQP